MDTRRGNGKSMHIKRGIEGEKERRGDRIERGEEDSLTRKRERERERVNDKQYEGVVEKRSSKELRIGMEGREEE